MALHPTRSYWRKRCREALFQASAPCAYETTEDGRPIYNTRFNRSLAEIARELAREGELEIVGDDDGTRYLEFTYPADE